MFKSILLKIAYHINKHYNTIEIAHNCDIKCYDTYFKIVEVDVSYSYDNSSTIELRGKDIGSYLKSSKVQDYRY